jgi:hypothetical protein
MLHYVTCVHDIAWAITSFSWHQVHDEYTALLKDVDYVRTEVAGSMLEFLVGLGLAVAALVVTNLYLVTRSSSSVTDSINGGIVLVWLLYVVVRVRWLFIITQRNATQLY